MIRITKKECPSELTDDVREELTREYKKTEKAVWKKPYIEKALMESSHGKCCYCECRLGQEGKYMEVEHYWPKSIYPESVADWDNLLPSCKRCNGKKSSHDTKEDPIIDPSKKYPREHLFVRSYRLYPKDELGRLTIDVLYLNASDRLVRPRFEVGDKTHEMISLILELARDYDTGTAKHAHRENRMVSSTKNLIRQGLSESAYAATVATEITDSSDFCELRHILQHNHLWDDETEELYRTMEQNSLSEKLSL